MIIIINNILQINICGQFQSTQGVTLASLLRVKWFWVKGLGFQRDWGGYGRGEVIVLTGKLMREGELCV